MARNLFDAPEWFLSLSLAERAPLSTPSIRDESWDADRAAWREQRWREQRPFQSEAMLMHRLAQDRLDVERFQTLLGEGAEQLARRAGPKPDWLKALEEAFERAFDGDGVAEPLLKNPDGTPQANGFMTAVEPILAVVLDRLNAGVRQIAMRHGGPQPLPFDPGSAVSLVLPNLPPVLFSKLDRTLVLELNVARLQGILEGETPESRFHHFSERLRTRTVLEALFHEYPVLARQLVQILDDWCQVVLEFFDRLAADWTRIRATLAEDDPGLLTEVRGGAGDTHRRGRSVFVLTFASGFRMVYKPRSLEIDHRFGDLLKWVNAAIPELAFRTLRMVEGDGYGWVEFVAAEACADEDALRRFYRRQGGYLALLYGLEATDFHLENLIASGEHPVLIDLEALLHPRVQGEAGSVDAANEVMGRSVLRVGLLPQRVWVMEGTDGLDMSGLGGAAGQMSPYQVLTWESAGTDEMHAVRKRLPITGAQNRPRLNDSDVDARKFTDEILEGFEGVYGLLQRERGALLAPGGAIHAFAAVEVRAVLRPTRTYARLLAECFHPDVLRDAIERDRLMDRLWLGMDEETPLGRAIPFEHRDLRRNDIPFFTARPNSCDLWASEGERLTGFFKETSLDAVARRLAEFGDEDLLRQRWFIRASMATLSSGVHGEAPAYTVSEAAAPAHPDALIAAATAVGDRLHELVLRGERFASWIGLHLINDRTWILQPLAADLYGGAAGVSLFLAYLTEVTGDPRHRELARDALQTMLAELEAAPEEAALKGEVGVFSGWCAPIYTLAHLASLWGDDHLLGLADRLLKLLAPLVPEDRSLDIISGSAGCILGMLSHHRVTGDPRALEVARACGDRLLETAETHGEGIAWTTPISSSQPLTGISHGAAGMAHGLLALFGATGDARYREAAERAIAYERAQFRPEAQNWPDYRIFERTGPNPPLEGSGMFAWCHGAPGIGLARLRALPHLDDPQVLQEVETAVATTLREGFGNGHSICHGDLGNLELVMEAGVVLRRPELVDRARRIAASILSSSQDRGWMCGNPMLVETPGLMTGLAGIGYALLRLAAPERVPSILLLDPPAHARRVAALRLVSGEEAPREVSLGAE